MRRTALSTGAAVLVHVAILATLSQVRVHRAPPTPREPRADDAMLVELVAPVLETVREEAPLSIVERASKPAAATGIAGRVASSTRGAGRSTRGGSPNARRGEGGGNAEERLDTGAPPGAGEEEEEGFDVENPDPFPPGPPPTAGWKELTMPPPKAPTAPPKRKKLTSEELTAMIEGDILRKDAELGLRQPETQKLTSALASELRMADLPDGARITFDVTVSRDGEVVAIVPGAQSAGDGSVALEVAASAKNALAKKKIGLGAFKSGAVVRISTTVVMAKPSGSTKAVTLVTECPRGGRMAKARELRDIPDIVPFDPTSPSYGSVAIGGSLYEARKTVDDFAPCFQLGGGFDLSDIGAKDTRQVRTNVSVRALPEKKKDEAAATGLGPRR